MSLARKIFLTVIFALSCVGFAGNILMAAEATVLAGLISHMVLAIMAGLFAIDIMLQVTK